MRPEKEEQDVSGRHEERDVAEAIFVQIPDEREEYFAGSGEEETGEEGGALQISPVPWTKEASFRLPVQVWKELMERWYPNSAVLRLRRDVFDRLYRFKVERGMATFDQAVEALLERGG